MNRKRGQAAMEFLMTYGWALLAIVIIGGLLWVYIGGKECGKSVSGALGQNVAITDHKVLANGAVTLVMENRAPDDVSVTSIGGTAVSVTLAKGGAAQSVTSAAGGVTAGTAGNCYKEEDVAVVYSVTGGTSHTLNLKTSGTYE